MIKTYPNAWKKPSGWVFAISTILGGIYIFDASILENLTPYLEVRVPYLFGSPIFGNNAEETLWDSNHILDEILLIINVISGITLGFSREKVEDELISKIRLESLAWSVYWNFGILIIATLVIYSATFLIVMAVQMVSILVWFNLRYSYRLRRHYKLLDHEE